MKKVFVFFFCMYALAANAQANDAADWSGVRGELESMFKTDQAMRKESNAMLADARAKGIEVDKMAHTLLWKRIGEQGRVNQLRVAQIIDQYGWPGISQVGAAAAMTVFLVVQHAELDYQLKYVDRMRDAALAGEAAKQQLALLEDRLLIRQGKPQRYGSQVETRDGVGLKPTEDGANLDARRAAMGLGSICAYLDNFVKSSGKIVYPPCVKETASAK